MRTSLTALRRVLCAVGFQVDIIKYTDDEYKTHLDFDKSWNKEQTDRLFEAARRFDLRWPVIADRLDLGASHPLPDIKNRFYTVTAKIIAARCVHGGLELWLAAHGPMHTRLLRLIARCWQQARQPQRAIPQGLRRLRV